MTGGINYEEIQKEIHDSVPVISELTYMLGYDGVWRLVEQKNVDMEVVIERNT